MPRPPGVDVALGLHDHGLGAGGPAGLLVHEAERTVDLLAAHAPPRAVIRGGHVLAGNADMS